MRQVRLIAVALAALVGVATISASAAADPQSCFVSATTVEQGGSLTITGTSDVNGEHLVALLDSTTQIGEGTTTATGTPITFSISATIPSTTAATGSHTLRVTNDAGEARTCPSIVVTAAAAPTPTVTATPAPATPPVVVVQQQQQQQQQQPDDRQSQRQPRHEHRRFRPRFVSTHHPTLPKTGTEIEQLAAIGGGLLGLGLALVLLARRRRRKNAATELPAIEAVLVEAELPWLRGTAHPSEFLPEPLYLPAPVHDDDVLTPSF